MKEGEELPAARAVEVITGSGGNDDTLEWIHSFA
jgi:hypothetical protein